MKRPSKPSGRSSRNSDRDKPAKGRSRATNSRSGRKDDFEGKSESRGRRSYGDNPDERPAPRGRASRDSERGGDRKSPRSKPTGNRTTERFSDKPAKRFENDFKKSDRGGRTSDSRREARDSGRDSERGRRTFTSDRRNTSDKDINERGPKRSYDSDRPKRYERGSDERPKRSYDSDSRKRNDREGDDKPRRSYDRGGEDKTRRSYDRGGDDKPRRSYDSDSRKRNDREGEEYSRPKRSYGSDDRRSGKSDDIRSDRRRDFSEEKPARSRRSDGDKETRGRYESSDLKRDSRRKTRDEEWSGSDKRSSDRTDRDDRRESKSARGTRSGEERHGRSWNESRSRNNEYNRPASDSNWDSFDKGGRNPSGYKPGKKYAEAPSRRPRVRYEEGELPPLQKEIRLNRFISMAGICSRREADELIEAGVISVNGEVITEMGFKVKPGDDVRYNGERIRNEKPVYVLLNKPKDYITTAEDPEGRKTVMELIAGACDERVYPVGRLDRNTTGLLLFTNDGDLARFLTHPSSRVKKIYAVELDKNFKVADMQKVREGLVLEDGKTEVDEIDYDEDGIDKKKVGIEIHSGKNRIVRRIFEHLGYEVKKLDRVIFAGLTKKDLPRGRWRLLTEAEINLLKVSTGAGKKKVKKPTKQEQDR